MNLKVNYAFSERIIDFGGFIAKLNLRSRKKFDFFP